MTSEMHAAPARATAPAPASELVLTDDQVAALQDAGLADFFDFGGILPAYRYDDAWWLRTDDDQWGRNPIQTINVSLDRRRPHFEKSARNFARFMSIRRAASGFKESGTSDGQ
jgi:hypothetical protein